MAEGGGGYLPCPVIGFIPQREGTALYRPLYSVLYSRGRAQLSTFSCVRFFIADGEEDSLPSPVFGYILELVPSLGEGTVSNTPPPLYRDG